MSTSVFSPLSIEKRSRASRPGSVDFGAGSHGPEGLGGRQPSVISPHVPWFVEDEAKAEEEEQEERESCG